MTRLTVLLAALLFSLGHIAVPPHAEALSCAQRLISNGDSPARVLGRCGEPLTRTQRIEHRSQTVYQNFGNGVFAQTFAVSVSVETWVYDFGSNRFMQELTFEDGVLCRIRALGYGSAR